MTDEPRHDHQASPGYAQEGGAELEHSGEPWGGHPETGEATAVHPEHVRGPRTWPRIVGVLLLFVIFGGVWAWQNPSLLQSSLRWLFPGSTGRDSAATEIGTLDARVARLEQALPSGLATLTQRLDALETRPGQTAAMSASQPPSDLRPLLARLDAIEARVAAISARSGGSPTSAPTSAAAAAQSAGGLEVQALSARLDALERQQAEQTADAARIGTLQAQVNALSAHNPADLSSQLDAMEHRVGELAANQTKLADTSDRAARLAQAEIALAAGRPLGSIPDAPPALARFATTAPPTEAGLRLSFAAASQAALQVSVPDTEGKPFFDRILARLQDFRLITVREGDHVVIGNSTAAILAHARVLLNVGDLGGATKAVGVLSGPPAAKMAPWLADATALQAAREALASLAENG
jgi:hypothetical protein